MDYNTYLSFTPGPTQIDERILNSMSTQVITHLNEAWGPYYLNVCEKLKKIVGTTGDCFLMLNSGSGGVECSVVSAVGPGEKILVLTNGLFGDRFGDIADAFNIEKEVMAFDYQEPLDPEKLRERLSQGTDGIAAVSCAYSESQTGMLNPVKELAAVCNEFDVPILVDAISAVGGVEFEMDAWGIDLALVSMQKCLGGTVGITNVFVADKAWKYFGEKEVIGYYYSLQKWRKDIHNFIKDPTSGPHPHPFSMSETLVFGTNTACDLVLEEGIDNRIKRHKEVYDYYVKELTAMGFKMYQDPRWAGPNSVSIYPHEKIGVLEMVERLKKEYGIMVGTGIGPLKSKLWRIGNMADQARMDKAVVLINSLKALLATC